MTNKVTKRFKANATWVAPAGVKTVKASGIFLRKYLDYAGAMSGGGTAYTEDGSLFCWGAGNANGEQGTGNNVGNGTPEAVVGGIKFKEVSQSGSYGPVFALSTEGLLYNWGIGNPYKGFPGIMNTAMVAKSSPILVNTSLRFKKLIGGAFFLTNDGDLYSAGGGGLSGEGGNGVAGYDVTTSTPVLVLSGANKWKDAFFRLAVDSPDFPSPAYAINMSDDLYAWGNGYLSGIGDNLDHSSPVLVPGGVKWKSIKPGLFNTMGLALDGRLFIWGENLHGQLGNGTVVDSSTPILVLAGKKIKQYGLCGFPGSYGDPGPAAYALTEDGELYAWGNNQRGQLGTNDEIPRSSPVLVMPSVKWKSIEVHGGNKGPKVNAISSTDDLYTWGENWISGTGIPYLDFGAANGQFFSSPIIIPGGRKWALVTQFNGGSQQAFTTDGQMFGWGTGPGSGDIDSSTPVLVNPSRVWSINTALKKNEVFFDVVPGQSYPILFTKVGGITFNGQSVSTLTGELVLEYEA